MNSLKQFSNFINELKLDNSRNYKLSILDKYKDNDDVKYYLHYIFNPYIVTGISDKKLKREVSIDCTTYLNSCKDILEYAKEHNTASDKDLSIIFTNKNTLLQRSEYDNDTILELSNLFDKIISKNLSLGIDSKSINKMIPNLIPTFDVQLANKYFEKPEVVEGKEFYLTTKIDGGRIIAIKEDNKVKFYTRQGQEYEGLVDLEQELLEKLPDNICLDGEITLLDPKNLTSEDQYKQTMMITRKDGEKHGVKMLVFDIMTSYEFKNQDCPTPYYKRREHLEALFKKNDYTYFKMLPVLYKGTDSNEILNWLNYNINKGEEGVMINIADAPYDFKRTNNLLKVKKFNSCDLRVLDMEEGTGKNQNKLGAFLCEFKDNNIVKVGSGLTDELREEIWNNKERYIGTIIEVNYFEETKNQQGGISLRFPTFKDFRPDKTEPNY